MPRVFALSLALALALVLVGPGRASPPPSAPPTGVALVTGAEDPTTHDFGSDRYAPGQTPYFLANKGLAEAAIAMAYGKADIGAVRTAHICLKPKEAMTLAGYDSALVAPDAKAWADDKAAAEAAYQRYTEARDAVLAGQPSPYPEFKSDEAAIRASAAAKTPEAKALFRRKALDELWRHAVVFATPKAYAEGVGKAGLIWLNARLTLEGCATDAENAAWLKATLGRTAWFDIKSYGVDADAAAWLIAEHADGDPALQLLVLERMGQLALTRQSNPANFAFLWDRVALNSGRPQRYGTQMRCVGRVWTPITPLEEPAKLDERRGWVNLGPEAISARNGAKFCGG